MAGPGLREFLYGLGTAGNTFVNLMLRAQESAQAHERQKELLGLKKGGPKGPGLAGMSEREIASNERAAIAENEMHQEVLKASGRRPGMPNQGSLSADEAAVLQRKRITPKGVDPAVAIPSAETGRSFASFDPEAERARIRERYAQGDVVPLSGPAFGTPMMGSFTKFMDAFRSEPERREEMYPSAQLEADMARNPFTKDLLAARDAEAADDAKTIRAGVKAAGVDAQGDLLTRRIPGLGNAALVEAGPMVGRMMAANRANASGERVSEAEKIATKRTSLTEASTKRLIAAREERDRRKGISEAISLAFQDFQDQGITPKDEEIIAQVPGATQADLDAFRKAPRAAKMPGRGEPPEQAAAKREQAAAQSALGSIRKAVLARSGGVLPGEIDSARQAYATLYGGDPTDEELATSLATTADMIAEGDKARKGPRPKVGPRRRATGAAPVTPTKTSTPTQGARDVIGTWRKYAGMEPAEKIRRTAADLGMTEAEVTAALTAMKR